MDENTINKLIGEKIRTLRKKSGLNQTQLALELSIHYKHLGMIESGRKAISIHLLTKLCNFFNKSPIYFFDYTAQEFKESDMKTLSSIVTMLKALDTDTRIIIAQMIKAAYELKNPGF